LFKKKLFSHIQKISILIVRFSCFHCIGFDEYTGFDQILKNKRNFEFKANQNLNKKKIQIKSLNKNRSNPNHKKKSKSKSNKIQKIY
jgi:hypothetical protein